MTGEVRKTGNMRQSGERIRGTGGMRQETETGCETGDLLQEKGGGRKEIKHTLM